MNKFFNGVGFAAVIMAAQGGSLFAAEGQCSSLEVNRVFVQGASRIAVIEVEPEVTVVFEADYAWPADHFVDGVWVQLIAGIDGQGAQTCVAQGFALGGRIWAEGGDVTTGQATFEITSPQAPGDYDVRFRYAEAYSAWEAVQSWWAVDGEPSEEATVATIRVN